jgi:hypothetical protein
MEPTYLSRRTFVRGALAASALSLLSPATAWAATAAGGWILIGSRTVNFAADHNTLPVTWLAGEFTHLQLRVHGNAVTMNELKVRFSNGEWVTLPVRARIRDGGQTRAIALPGGRRYISLIQFYHRSTTNGRGRATVDVLGQR